MSKIKVKRIIGHGTNKTVAILEINGVQSTKTFEANVTEEEIEAKLKAGVRVELSASDVFAANGRKIWAVFSYIWFRKGSDQGRTKEIAPPSPPKLAEFIFSLLAPRKTVDAQIGDLQEVFEHRVKTFGYPRARRLYWSQVLRAVGPNLWRLIRKWGLIGVLIDYGRSKLGL